MTHRLRPIPFIFIATVGLCIGSAGTFAAAADQDASPPAPEERAGASAEDGESQRLAELRAELERSRARLAEARAKEAAAEQRLEKLRRRSAELERMEAEARTRRFAPPTEDDRARSPSDGTSRLRLSRPDGRDAADRAADRTAAGVSISRPAADVAERAVREAIELHERRRDQLEHERILRSLGDREDQPLLSGRLLHLPEVDRRALQRLRASRPGLPAHPVSRPRQRTLSDRHYERAARTPSGANRLRTVHRLRTNQTVIERSTRSRTSVLRQNAGRFDAPSRGGRTGR